MELLLETGNGPSRAGISIRERGIGSRERVMGSRQRGMCIRERGIAFESSPDRQPGRGKPVVELTRGAAP